MSTFVQGICGAELHEKRGYGVYISDGTTTPPTWSLATDVIMPEGVMVSADRDLTDGTSTGERCTVCVFGEVEVYTGGAVTPAGPALICNSSGAFVESTTFEQFGCVYPLQVLSSSVRTQAWCNFLQSNRQAPADHHVPAMEMVGTTGTWTLTVATNLPSQVRTASSASNGVIHIPFGGSRAGKIAGVKLNYTIGSETANDVAIAVYKVAWEGAGDKMTATAVTGAYNAAYDTAGERGAVESHEYTYTLTTPVLLTDAQDIFATVTITDTTGGSAAVSVHGASWFYSEVTA